MVAKGPSERWSFPSRCGLSHAITWEGQLPGEHYTRLWFAHGGEHKIIIIMMIIVNNNHIIVTIKITGFWFRGVHCFELALLSPAEAVADAWRSPPLSSICQQWYNMYSVPALNSRNTKGCSHLQPPTSWGGQVSCKGDMYHFFVGTQHTTYPALLHFNIDPT